MKKLTVLMFALVLTFALAGCGKGQDKSAVAPIESLTPAATTPAPSAKSDQAKAEEVLRTYLKADDLTYKDESSYHAADKYSEKSFAELNTKQREEANLYKTTTEHKVVTTTDINSVSFVKQDGAQFVFDAKLVEHDYSDELKKEFRTQTIVMQYTVQKQTDASFLVSKKTVTSKDAVSH